MTDTPKLNLKHFLTVSYADRLNKSKNMTATKLSCRKKASSRMDNPESFFNATLSIEKDNSLPKINERKKKKPGSYLQNWLDDALGSGGDVQPDRPQVDGGIMKTLKKFELDRRYLQSQNIPLQKIERLYQSLYIYSHGIDSVFKQLLTFVHEIENNDLLGNFWRAFVKLLEGCTSYQTVFQKVEQTHLQNIANLKHNIEFKHEIFEEQKKSLSSTIEKLSKKLEESENNYKKLEQQYNVMNSTLILTDTAFNEEVHLRLKFEEKINAVYTSYEELKAKYEKIVEEIAYRNEDSIERERKQNEMKSKLLVERTKVEQLQYFLAVEMEKVKERDLEVAIKKQEIDDLKEILQAKFGKQNQVEGFMEEQIMKIKALKTKEEQLSNVILGQKITIKQQQEHTAKLLNHLEQSKKSNDDLYEKYMEAGNSNVKLESTIFLNNLKINEHEKSLAQKLAEVSDTKRQLDHVVKERNNLRSELDTMTINLRNSNATMQKNSKLLEQMKAVKDKYERINEIYREEVVQLEKAYNEVKLENQHKTQEIEGLKLVIDSRVKALAHLEKQIEQQREVNKTKMAGLNSAVNKKQGLILEYQNKKEEYDIKLEQKEKQLKAAQDKCIIMESNKIKMEIEASSLKKRMAEMDSYIEDYDQKYRAVSSKLQALTLNKQKLHEKLQSTEFVLTTRNSEQNIEIHSLNRLLAQYKEIIVQKSSYIHPMIYQQCHGLSVRALDGQQKLKKQLEAFQEKTSKIKSQCYELNRNNKEKDLKIAQLEEKVKKISSDNSKLFSSNRASEEKYQEVCRNRKKLEDENSELERRVRGLERSLEQAMEEMKRLVADSENSIRVLKREIESNKKKRENSEKELQSESKLAKPKPQVKNREMQTEALETLKVEVMEREVQTNDEGEMKHEEDKLQVVNSKQETHEEKKEQAVMQKKVQNKDFKKALKLTYMRR